MHHRVRILCTWSLLGSFLAPLPAVAQSAFRDTASSPYAQAIAELRAQGAIEGYGDGSFKPTATINRAEFLKIVLAARDGGESPRSTDGCFPDVPKSAWFAPWVCAALEEGIIDGYPDGTFRPEREIAFVESAKILANAFGQDVQGDGEAWYEPYAQALDTSRAIPTTVDSLEARVERGEMAEMLWRLTAKRTDRPSKSLENVRNPELSIDLSSDEPQRGATCSDLSLLIGQRSSPYPMLMKAGGMQGADAGVPMASARNEAAVDYSGTNVQVGGVDEADIVKTDGTYVYMVRGGRVTIVRASPASDLQHVADIEPTWAASSDEPIRIMDTSMLADQGGSISDIYVDGDRLVVIGSGWRSMPYPALRETGSMEKRLMMPGSMPSWTVQKTLASVYDIASPASPKHLRTVAFDGHAVSTRRIGDTVTLVLQQQLPWWGGPVPLAATAGSLFLPVVQDSAGDATIETRCQDVQILPRVPATGLLTVASLPIGSATAKIRTNTVLANAENVYASAEHLYLAANEWIYDWRTRGSGEERTRLYRFDLGDADLSMDAHGSVPGRLLNQFSMDEHGATFRVATTVGNTWDSSKPSASALYVLNEDLEIAGSVEGLAPGEQIYSVRFMGDRAYIVTFKKIDPLFVIDTSNPRAPKVLGKLKIPGYSDYLHPVGEHHLLGFGKDAVAAKDGDFAWYQGVKVALFDVSDVENPQEVDSQIIGDRGSDSPLLTNHKALLFDEERDLLAFPVSVAKLSPEQRKSNDGSAYGSTVFQGAYVYDVSTKNGLTLKGTITHYDDNDAFLKAGDWWYGGGHDIQRVLRLGDNLLTVSSEQLRSPPVRSPETEIDTLVLP